MLVLSRKRGQSVVVDSGRITVTVLSWDGDKVRLGFEAVDRNIEINRREVQDRIHKSKGVSNDDPIEEGTHEGRNPAA